MLTQQCFQYQNQRKPSGDWMSLALTITWVTLVPGMIVLGPNVVASATADPESWPTFGGLSFMCSSFFCEGTTWARTSTLRLEKQSPILFSQASNRSILVWNSTIWRGLASDGILLMKVVGGGWCLGWHLGCGCCSMPVRRHWH